MESPRASKDLYMDERSCDEAECAVSSLPCFKVYVQPGQRCRGPWKKLIPIGEHSSNAHVYIIESSTGEREHVLKIMSFDTRTIKPTVEDARAALYREVSYQNIAAAAGLAPKIIQVIDNGLESGIIMEGMQTTLARALDKNNAKQLFEQAEALVRALHKIGIAHGDLHFNNFMLGHDGKMYLIDFGYAREATFTTKRYDIGMFTDRRGEIMHKISPPVIKKIVF